MTMLVRSASLTNYATVARAAGLDPAAMLQSVGLDPSCLDDPDLKIPGAAASRLLEESARASGWTDFGLRLAASRTHPSWGPLTLAVREQATLRQALTVLVHYMRLHSESLQLHLEEDAQGATAMVRFEFTGRGPEVRQSMELAVAALTLALRQLLPDQWKAQKVCFMHAKPADTRTARRLFSNVEYGAPLNGILFPASYLQLPLSNYAQLDRYAKRYLESMGADLQGTLEEKVRQLIISLLPSGGCSLEHIAGRLTLDPRTVRRQLAREGHSYASLLNAIRRELAERHLAHPNRSLAEVGALLGFRDASSFSRWFRDNFGCSGREWQRAQR
ncbi:MULTISPECIES: AraC family transcriptional regulator [Ramlibacter]|nr:MULTISPECIES: AraC family transcriptional regulator [Ramlibacter]MBA2962349.1 AraC family transcriptional regulator [Ramlibacter sp. CGMCC 1.13660]